MSTSLDRIASGTNSDGEPVGRGTGCANVRTSGSVGAPGGNTSELPTFLQFVFEIDLAAQWNIRLRGFELCRGLVFRYVDCGEPR